MKKLITSKSQSRAGYRSISQIRGRVQSVCGRDACYRLYEVRRNGVVSYAVNVSYCGEGATRGLGCGRRAALWMFEALTRGCVTTVTLGDVVSDWEYSDLLEA